MSVHAISSAHSVAAAPRTSKNRLRRPQRLLSLALLSCVAVLWIVSLPQFHPAHMTDIGMVSVMPPAFFVALAGMLLSFCLALRHDPLDEWILVAHVVLLIMMLYGLTSLTEPEPRFEVAYRHAGFAEYIMRTGQSNGMLDSYFNWPGFFVFSAFLTRVAGLSNIISLTSWAPPFFNLLYLAPLAMIFRALTTNRRRVWLALWIFYLGNWIDQDYFAPQAFGFFVSLVIMAILLTYFARTRGPSANVWSPSLITRSILRLTPLTSWTTTIDGGGSKLASPWRRVAAVTLAMSLFVIITMSHQLTPIAILLMTSLLVVLGCCNTKSLPFFMAACVATWISFGAVAFMGGHMVGLLKSMGSVHSAVGANVANRFHGSPEHEIVIYLRIVLTGILWLASCVYLAKSRKNLSWSDISAAAVLFAPFILLLLQAYGGEMLLRVYLFGLPGAAFLASGLFFGSHGAGTSAIRTALLLVASGALLAGFLFARYGNERMDYMSPGDIATMNYLYKVAKPGSAIVGVTTNLPWKFTHLEQYDYNSVSVLDPTERTKILVDLDVNAVVRLMRSYHRRPAYLVFTRSVSAEIDLFLGLGPHRGREIEQTLVHSGQFRAIFDNGDGQILVLNTRSHA